MDGTELLEKPAGEAAETVSDTVSETVPETAPETIPENITVPESADTPDMETGAYSPVIPPDDAAKDIPTTPAESIPDIPESFSEPIDEQSSENVNTYVSEYIGEYTSEAVSETRRIIAETEEENERLSNLFRQEPARELPEKAEKKPYTIGILSAAASLVYIGTVLLITLMSPVEAFKAIYFAPAILIFLGAEALFAVIRRKTLHISLDIKSAVICLSLIVVTFILSAISKTSTPADVQRTYAADRIRHMIARDISEALSCDYIRNVEAAVTLCADDPRVYSSPDDLMVGDTVDITVYFSDAKMSIREFASDCRLTLDELETLGIAFGEVKFINDDRINRYTIIIDWLYQENYDELRLAEQADYFGDNISDNDIADITDDMEDDE